MSMEAYEKSMELCKYIEHGSCKLKKVEKKWRDVFGQVLKDMGYPKECRDDMWYELVQGNWERLHFTEDDEKKTVDDWLDEFRGDVFYCSDRWSLDRLCRTHWLFRAYRKASGAGFYISRDGDYYAGCYSGRSRL